MGAKNGSVTRLQGPTATSVIGGVGLGRLVHGEGLWSWALGHI
jgi:hypothetical protein